MCNYCNYITYGTGYLPCRCNVSALFNAVVYTLTNTSPCLGLGVSVEPTYNSSGPIIYKYHIYIIQHQNLC